MKRKKTMNRAGARGDSLLARVTAAIVMMLTLAVSGAWAQEPTKYTVTMAEDTEDTTNWTVSPTEAAEGATVTATYNGTRHVKSVTAVVKSPLATPLTIEALTDGKIVVNMSGKLSTGMKYSLDGGKNKTTIYETTEITVTAGQKVQFYGVGTDTKAYGNRPEVKLQGRGDGFKTKVYGNIMSLLDEEGFATATALPDKNDVFYGLFSYNTTLTDASGLLLPATTLATACYQYMFYGCKGLTAAPALPATTLADGCYVAMFSGCISLITAPELPAETLAKTCYNFMFENCKSLTAAPELPAKELVTNCYYKMFYGCSNLASVTCLATSGINVSKSTDNWLNGVSATGTFTADPNADWGDASINTIPSGWTRLNPDGSTYVTLATPLTMEAITDGTIKVYIDGTLSTGMKYSLDGGKNKTTIYETTEIPVTAGQKVQFYGVGTDTKVYGNDLEVKLQGSGDGFKTKVYGNIMSLIDEENFATNVTLLNQDYVFFGLFKENTTLTDASGLLLPATTLAKHSYSDMFSNCTALTAAPALPATTLASNCYNGMFNGCSVLTAAPALPAETLAEGCYIGMFKRCTTLTEAPALPATTLARGCYFEMFYGCSNLSSVTCLATGGINTDVSTTSWLKGVAATGTFTADPNATTWPSGDDGIPSGWTRLNPDGTEWVAP